LGDEDGRNRFGIFEQVHRLYLATQGQIDISKICEILRTELSAEVKSDFVLFIKFSKKAERIDLLASSSPKQSMTTHHSVDEGSIDWLEKQKGCKIAWFPTLEHAPGFIEDVGADWHIGAAVIYLGDLSDGTMSIIVIGATEPQSEEWMNQSPALVEKLRGAELLLDNVHLIAEVGNIRTDIKAVFDLAPVGIIMIDSDGTLTDINNQALSILGGGHPIDSMVGDSIITNSWFKDSGLDVLIEKTLEGQEMDNDNFKLKIETGRVSYLHVKLRPVPKPDGSMMAVGVLTDETNRIHLQQQLERSYRTLTEAFQELQRVDKMKTKFIDVVSHELRTPLTVMRGYLELLESEYKNNMDAKVMSKMHVMKANADRMYDLVESMLDVAQIEKGAMEVTRHDASIKALIEEVVASQRPFSTEKHQELTIVSVGEIGNIQIDAKKIRDAMKNIVNNAIRYTPEGGKIQVGIADEGKMIHIWVKDNGVGIPTADLEKIFDRFHIVTAEELSYQVDRIGLGLPITKGIIEGHGGKIWVESEVGRGSIFHINIPKE
jgi:PAS domain S-box-containing protein